MNKIVAFLIALIVSFSSINANAQGVVYSPYEKYDVHNGSFAVVGKVGERTYVYRTSDDGYFLDAYNDNMERIATVILDFFPAKIYAASFIAYPDKIMVLYQGVEGAKLTQYAALLDGNGKLLKRPVSIATDHIGLFSSGRTYFSFAVSGDKKNIVVYNADDKGDKLVANFVWLNDELQIDQKAAASFDAGNDVSHGDPLIGNDGAIYFPAYTAVGGKNYADGLWMLKLVKGEKKFTAKEFPLGDNYAGGTFMKMDNDQQRVYIGGFYSDKKNGNYQGILYANYDLATSDFQNVKTIAFSDKLREAAGGNEKRALNNYQVKQMIIKNDGGFVLVSEDVFITSRSSYAPGFGYYSWYYPAMANYVREYHYDDVLCVSCDADGNIQWQSFIRKNQYSQEDNGIFSSYALINTGGALGFLFNDFNTRRSTIQLASVEADGKVNIKSLSTQSDDPDWLPRQGKQVGAREIVIPCLRKRQICFAKVVF